MASVLCPVPDDQPRPTPLSVEVITRSYGEIEEDLVGWVRKKVNKQVSVSSVAALVISCVRDVGLDAFQVAVRLQTSAGWPGDMELLRILDRMMDAQGFAFRVAMAEWVMVTGVRFPAKTGDTVTWQARGRKKFGLVHEVLPNSASALVYPLIGSGLAAEPVKVLAEEVTSNHTQQRTATMCLRGP